MEKNNILGLEIKEELHSFNVGISHYKVCSIDAIARGHGSDFNRELALKKALHEYVERYYFRQHLVNTGFKTTNGIAAHSSKEKSKSSAINEILERHVFISHWLQAISPSWLDDKNELEQLLTRDFLEVLKQMQEQNYLIRFGILAKVNNLFVVIGIVKKNKETGYVVACSTDKNLSVAIEKCLIDSIRAADLIESRLKNNLNLFNYIKSSEVKNPEEHLEYYLNEENWIGLEWFFDKSNDIREYNIPNIETISWVESNILPWDVHLSVAISSQLQNLYFGETKIENIHISNLNYVKNFKLHPFA